MLPGGGSFQSAKVRIFMRRCGSGTTRAIFLDRVTNALGSLQDHSPIAKMRARKASADAPLPAGVAPGTAAPAATETEAAASGGR